MTSFVFVANKRKIGFPASAFNSGKKGLFERPVCEEVN